MSALQVIPLLKRHRAFVIISSFGLALLYAEEGWAAYSFWSKRTWNEAAVLIVLVTVVAFAGYLVSFLFPPLLVRENWSSARAWGVLIHVTTWSIGITVLVNVVVFMLLLYLIDFDLIATYNLLRDIYLYALVAILFFHGLLLYVRYTTHLYQTPDFVQPLKVVAASTGVAVLMFLITSFLFSLDIRRLDDASPALEGLIGLHVYGRFLYLLTLSIAAYIWHLRWIADH